MNSDLARKYLSGEVSVTDLSQPSAEQNPPDPSNASTPTEESGGGDSQLENSNSHTEETEAGAATQTSESEDGTGSSDGNPKDDKQSGKTETEDKGSQDHDESFLNSKKDNRKPYPKADSSKKDPKNLAQIKANEAFIRQKNKYKAKVRSLEDQIVSLKKQLMSYNAVDPEEIKNDTDKMIDLKLAKNMVQTQIKGLEDQRQSVLEDEALEEAERINQQRIDTCFVDETEKSHYQTLLTNGRDKFVQFLNTYDPENAVLQYLDDSDNSPLLIRTLMTNPEVLKSIISKRSPISKAVELKQLENRIMLERRLRSVSPKSGNIVKPEAKKVPSTGSQTNPGSGSNQDPVRDRNYWKNYLATHS